MIEVTEALTWRDVMDFKGAGTREMAAKAALGAGNTYFCFNGLIYTAGLYPSEGGGVHIDYRETNLTAKDLEPKMAPPRVPPIGKPKMGKRPVQVIRMSQVIERPAGAYEIPSDTDDAIRPVKMEITFSCGHSCWVPGASIEDLTSGYKGERRFVPENRPQEETRGLPTSTTHTEALHEGIGGIVLCDLCDPVPSYGLNAAGKPVFVGDEIRLASCGLRPTESREWWRITLLTVAGNPSVVYAYVDGQTYAVPVAQADTRAVAAGVTLRR
jgi:hypothetical protein